MENEVVQWQAVFAPKDVVARTFKSESNWRLSFLHASRLC